MRRPSMLLSRLALRRRPVLYWLCAALVATTTVVVVGGLTARAERAASRFGGLRDVAVADRALRPGDEVGDGDVTVRRVPRAFVPDNAMAAAPVGRTVLTPVYPGEAVLTDRLAPDGLRGVAALLPPGTLAMALPTGAGGIRLAVGDRVDVLATEGIAALPEPTSAPEAAVEGGAGGAAGGGDAAAVGAGATRTVASAAVVVDVSDENVTVAVREAEAPVVATALTQAAITLALSTAA